MKKARTIPHSKKPATSPLLPRSAKEADIIAYETTGIGGPKLSDLQLDWLRNLSEGTWNIDAVMLLANGLYELLKGHSKVTFGEDRMSVQVLTKIVRAKLKRTHIAVKRSMRLDDLTAEQRTTAEKSLEADDAVKLKHERSYGRQHGV